MPDSAILRGLDACRPSRNGTARISILLTCRGLEK
jgi:hypothetical protein